MSTTTFMWFPGQGVQRPGMCQQLASASNVANDLLEEASEVLSLDLRQIMWESSDAELAQTENAQPAIVAASVATFRAWRLAEGESVEIDWGAGHSIGALSAAICCGYFDFADGIALARKRGELMASTPGDGGMLAVSVTNDQARERCLEVAQECELDVASYNGSRQMVLAGAMTGIEKAEGILGSRSTQLNVSHGFHSRLMEPAVQPWRELVESAPVHDGAIGYFGSCSGQFASGPQEVVADLADALRNPVRWDLVLQESANCGGGYIFGAGKSLARMWRKRPKTIPITVVDEARMEKL